MSSDLQNYKCDMKDTDFAWYFFTDIGAGITKKEERIHGRFRKASHHVNEWEFLVQRQAEFSRRQKSRASEGVATPWGLAAATTILDLFVSI